MNDDVLKLYNSLQKYGYNNLGTSEEFGTKVQDSTSRRKLYDSLTRDGFNNLGTFEEFSGRLVTNQQKSAAAPRKALNISLNPATEQAYKEMMAPKQEERPVEQPKQQSQPQPQPTPAPVEEATAEEPEVNPFPYRGGLEQETAEIARLRETVAEDKAFVEEYEKIKNGERKRNQMVSGVNPLAGTDRGADAKWLKDNKDRYKQAKANVEKVESVVSEPENAINKAETDIARRKNREEMASPSEIIATGRTPFGGDNAGRQDSEHQLRKYADELYASADKEYDKSSKYQEGYEGNALEQLWTGIRDFGADALNNIDSGSFTFGLSKGLAGVKAREVGDKYNSIIDGAIKDMGMSEDSVKSILSSIEESVPKLEALEEELTAAGAEIDTMSSTYEDMVRRGDPNAESYGRQLQKKIDAYNKRINDEYKPTWDAYNDNRQAYEDVMAGIDTAIESGLTGGEKALLDALEKFTQAKTLRSDDVSVAGKAGAGAEQSAEFMLDFILTGGISKAGTKVATKIATNRALKKFGADALKEMARVGKTVKPGLGLRLGTDVVTSLARTGVMAPRTIQAYSENLTEYNGKDETGRYEWDRSQANALANSLLTQYIEYWSEGFGEYFGEAERALFRGVTKNAPKTAIGQTLKGYRGSIGQYLDKGKFDGMFNEMLEEVVGSTFNALAGWMSGDRVGDSKAMKEFVSGENLATLALSFLPMSAIGAATNLSAYHKMKERYDKGVEGLSDYFKTGAVSPEELQQLSKDIPNLSPEEIKDKIVDITDRARKQNGGRLPSDFTQNVLGYLEGEFAMGLRYDEWEDSQEKMSVVNAYTASYTNPDARAAWDLNNNEQTARQAAMEAGFTEDELDNDSYMLAQEAFEIRGTQPERSDILMNYASAKAAAEGLRMGYKEQTQQVSEIFDERVRRNVDTNGTVTTATIMLNGKPRTVFITQEDASVDANGNLTTPTGPDGVVRYRLNEMDKEGKTAPASQFSNVQSTDTTQFIDGWQNNFQQKRAAYYETAQNTVSPTGQARALNERVGQSVIVTDHNGVYQPFKVERLTNGGSSVVLSGDKKALQGVAEAMGIRVPTSGYLEAPVTSLYPLLAKEEDGSLSTGVGETSQQEAATPAQEAAPAAEQAAGLGDLRDQTVPISVNGQVQNAHVIDMSDGSVMYEELDENGDVVRTSRLSETDFARAMQEAANPTPAAETPAAAVEETPAPEAAAPVIPVDEKTGEKMYSAPGVRVEDAIADLYATEGLTEADVDQYIAEEAAKAEAARNPERGSMSPQAWGQAKQEAARVADFWAAMQRAAEQRKAQQEEAIEEAVEEATPVETERQAKPRTAPRLEDLIPESEDKIVSRLENWSKRTGVNVRIVNSIDEVSDTKAKKALKEGRRLTGWYLPETNEVEVYLPNITNTIEADKTFIHEAVAHKGLLGLLGRKGYDELCDRVWNEMMTPEEQQEFLEYNRHLSGSEEFLRRAAADEYIARLSESLDMPDKRNIFERIIDWIMDKLGWGRDVSGIENAAAKRVAGLETITRSDLYDLLEDSLKRFEKGRKKVSDILQDENGDVRFSEATYMPFKDEFGNEHEGTRQQLINYMVGQGFPQKQIDDFVQHMDYWYDFTQNIANLVNPDGTFKYQAFHDWSETIPEYKIYEGKIVKAISTLVTNGEYPLNFELSTDCIKREAFTQIINEMLKMDASFWKKLTPANIIEIQNLEKAFGIEVACPLCFVEAKRLNILTWATGVAEKWNTALKAVAPGVEHTPFGFYKDGDMTVDQVERRNGEVLITQKVKKEIDTINSFLGDAKNLRNKDAKRLRDNAKEMEKLLNGWIEEYGAEHDGDITGFTLTKKQEAQLEKVRNRNMKSATGRMMRIIAAHPEVRHTLSPMDLLGSTGLMRIQSMEGEGFAEMLSAIVSANGTGTPKIVQSAVPYDGEIIDVPQARFEKAAGIGGARLFSFSDADLTKIFDIMQIMWDCAARQAKVQSYSKEVPYIVLFGTSGVKINMSMLPEARPGEAIERQYKSATKAGKQRIKHDVEENVGLQLDQDGNIVGLDLSDSHSITDEFARWIFHNPEYNANCGAIMVGIGVNHAIYCMMQPHIRMLIPFHLSGMPLAAREKGDVFWYHDFTNEQNTGVMVNGLRVKLMGKDGSIVPSVKEDFNIYEGEEKEDWDIRDRCRAYIKWCDENGLLPKFPWAVNAEGYANWMREHGYEPRQDFIDAMNAHTTDGVWDEYYKVITDFTAYQPEFDAEGNMIGEKSARHLPVTGRINTDPKLLQAVFGTNAEGTEVTSEDSMLNNRERSIENANRHAKEIAALAINMLNSGKKASDMVDMSGSQFNNKADSELFLQERELPASEDVKALEKEQPETDAEMVAEEEVANTMFREVTDPATVEWFNNAPKTTGFRTVVKKAEDTYGSPMAGNLGQVKGKKKAATSSFMRNVIEQAEENPDIADENGKVKLIKPKREDGKKLTDVGSVDYNPYIHLRLDKINRQFKDAWKRDDLIYIESEVPVEEVPDFRGEKTPDYSKSPYHAEKAALPVGIHDWNGGALMLSRYDRPFREVPWKEVADAWAADEDFQKNGVHFDIVPPQMRDLLTERGIEIIPPHNGMGQDCFDAYNEWKGEKNGPGGGGTRFRESITPAVQQEMEEIKRKAQADGSFMQAPNGNPTNLNEEQWLLVRTKNFKNWFGDWENDPANASKIVDENGEPRVVYHGTKWNPLAEEPGKAVFDVNRVGENFDFVDIDWNFFFTASEASARGYGNAVPVFLNMRNPEVHTIREEVLYEIDDELGHDIVVNAHDAGSENDEVARVENPDGVIYTIRAVNVTESDRKFSDAIKKWEGEHKQELEDEYNSLKDQRDVIVKQLEDARRSLYDQMGFADIFYGKSYDEMKEQVGYTMDEVIDSAAKMRNLSTEGIEELARQFNDIDQKMFRIFRRVDIEGRPEYEDYRGDEVEYDYHQTDMFALDNPNQIKSATANNGEFDPNNPDIRFRERITPEQDKEYMDAVEAGDMEKAGRMVRDAFKAAFPDTKVVDENGEPILMYHGSPNTFTKFWTTGGDGDLGEGSYFTNDWEVADSYTGRNGDNEWAVDSKIDRFFYDHPEKSPANNDDYKEATDWAVKEAFKNAKLYAVYLNIENPRYTKTDDFNYVGLGNYLKERSSDYRRGYDGIIDRTFDQRYPDFTNEGSIQVVVFEPNQIKLADPVTYDDNGNVIPLSERFNPENNDIRFREARPVDARNAQAGYEEEINRKVTNFLLEWQDQDIPVRIAINQVMNEVGMENLPEDCDYLTRHNLVSSRADAQMHNYKLFYFEPMMQTIGQIEDILVGGKPGFFDRLTGRRQKRLDAYNKIVDYCYAVSALERNAWKRAEAQRLMEKALERLSEKWEQERAAINADSRLNDAEKAESLDRAEKRYLKERDEIEAKYADRDYSGITALMGHSKEEWQEAEDDARAMIADFQRSVNNNNLINEMWDRIRACTDFNLEHAYKYGLLSRAEYERLHGTESQPRMWEYYIPLRGFAEDTAEDQYNYTMFTSDMAGGDVVKKAKGRTTEADDPFATMRHISEQEIVQGLQNWAKQALYNFVLRAGNNSLLTQVEPWYVKEPGSDNWTVAEPNEGETLEEFEARMQEAYEDGDARRGRNGLKLGRLMGNKMHRNQHTVRLKLNGAEKMIWVNGNPILAQAINGISGWNNKILNGVRTVNRALSQFYTTYSLKFLTKNKLRDTQFSRIAALVDEPQAYLRQLEKNWWANNGYVAFGYPMMKLVSAWESGELEKKENRTEREQMFVDFMYDGGATGYTMINSMDKIKRELERMVKNAGRGERNIPIIDWYAKGVGALNEASELLTRFTFYQTSRMMGRSRERSAYDAKESSVNFNRRGLRSGIGVSGWTSAAASALYLFINPAIQGLDKFVRLHKSHPWRMGLVDATYFMMGFVNSLLNAMIAGASDGDGDDEEKMGPDWYWNIPEWVRRSNMIIGSPFKKLGKWGYLVLALPIEYKGFYAMGELASALVQGKYAAKDAPTIANEVVGVVAELLPVNPVEGYTPGDNPAMSVVRNLMPDIAAPIMDVATNRSFAGIPLWKENIYDEAQPLSQSAFASTPEILNKAVIKLSEVTSDMPWHVDIPSGAVRGLLKGYGGGAYTFVEDMSKLIFADEAHPRRWDNVPFVSGFTGYLEEDRRDSFNSNALQRYKELSDDVVKRVRSAAPGEDLKAADIYNHPESLPQNARVTILLNSDRYILGQMYYNGMLKAGDDVKKLRSNWNKAKKAYLEIADDKNVSDEAKDAAEKEVQRTWLEYTMAEDGLVDRLMEEEYNHARQKIANGIPYEPKETLGEKAYKLTNRK